MEQLREETLAYFRAAAEAEAEERYAAEQQRVREAQEKQDEIYSAIDEAFVVDLTDEELQAEVDAFGKAHEGQGLTVEELKAVRAEEERIRQEQANAAKQAEIDRLNTQYPGMLQMQQDAGQQYEELTHYMLKRQQDMVLRAAYALLPELQALPDLMQKFTVDAMQKLNEHHECRNIVYKMNMMEFTGPLPVSPDGVVSELPAPAVTVKMMG